LGSGVRTVRSVIITSPKHASTSGS
jgi:hypothetical protein